MERVVLNALAVNAALPPNIGASGDGFCRRLREKSIHLGGLVKQNCRGRRVARAL